MIPVPVLAWCMVLVGIVIALRFGWRAKGGWQTLGLLFADAVMGVAMGFILFFIVAVCTNAGLCAQTDDRTVWSLAFPIMFVPAYWLATLLAKACQFWEPGVEETTSDRPQHDGERKHRIK